MTAWVAFYPDDYLGDTQDLSLLEHGAYVRLLVAYYASDGKLVSDNRRLYRLCGAFDDDEQRAVDAIVVRYFQAVDGYLRHDRADHEIGRAKHKSEAARKANAVRWESSRNPTGVQTESDRNPTGGNPEVRSDSSPEPEVEVEEEHRTTPQNQNVSTTSPSGSPSPAPDTQDAAQKAGNGDARKTAHRFDEFWAVYPKRRGKADAEKAWKAGRCDQIADTIVGDVRERQRRDHQWLKDDGKFIPYPATYLRNQRWEDEYERSPTSGSGTTIESIEQRAERMAAERKQRLSNQGGQQ